MAFATGFDSNHRMTDSADPDSPAEAAPSPPTRTQHVPVLLREVLQTLDLTPGLTVVDGTLGGGGHSRAILQRIGPTGRLIGLDRDARMVHLSAARFSGSNVHLVHASYAHLPRVLKDLNIDRVDRILLDLGWCSDQLADAERGFSFQTDGPLDLRYDVTGGKPAWKLLDVLGEDEIAKIIETYGEDHLARQHARRIVAARNQRPLRTTFDLVSAITGTPAPWRSTGSDSRHPATQVFQALRIAVNEELEQLQEALNGVCDSCLTPHGILAVISFHSLEDRMVKLALRDQTRWQAVLSKPLAASPAEQRLNPRSRTALLRAARKKPPALQPSTAHPAGR